MCSACFFTAYSENSIIANRRGNSFNLGLLEKINNCLMLEMLNPARISEIYESLIDFVPWYRQNVPLSFRKSLIITIYNLHKEIWYCKSDTQNLSKQKDRRKVRRPVISTQLLWSIDISRIFFCQWKSTKICRKAKHDILLHISCLFGQKRTITQGTSAPEGFFCPGGILAKKIFPQETFVQERPSLPRRPFFSKKMSTSLELLCKKSTPSGKVCGLKQECWQNRNQTLGDCSKRKVDLQTKEQLWNFLLLRAWFYFSQAIQSHVQQRKKT